MIFANQRSSEKHRFILIANQYLSAVREDLPENESGAITELVNALYENNLWDKFIAVYPFAGSTIEKASLNLIDPFKYKITWSGSVFFNSFGITGNGGVGYTNIPASLISSLSNLHLSAYVRTPISSTSGSGRLIGVNTKSKSLKLKEIAAIELNFNKEESGANGFVYNIINNNINRGAFGLTFQEMTEQNIPGNGFFIANNFGEIKDLKCYLNGQNFGYQHALLPTEINKLNIRKLTIFGNGYDDIDNNNSLRANISFISVGYGLSSDDVYNFNNIIQNFQAAMGRSLM